MYALVNIYDNQNASISIANRLASRIIFALVVCQPAIYFRISEGITRRFSGVCGKLWKTYFLETYGGIRRRIPFQWNLGEKPPERELYVFLRKIFEARSCEFFLRINTLQPLTGYIISSVMGRRDGIRHAREKLSLGKITSSKSTSGKFLARSRQWKSHETIYAIERWLNGELERSLR